MAYAYASQLLDLVIPRLFVVVVLCIYLVGDEILFTA